MRAARAAAQAWAYVRVTQLPPLGEGVTETTSPMAEKWATTASVASVGKPKMWTAKPAGEGVDGGGCEWDEVEGRAEEEAKGERGRGSGCEVVG